MIRCQSLILLNNSDFFVPYCPIQFRRAARFHLPPSRRDRARSRNSARKSSSSLRRRCDQDGVTPSAQVYRAPPASGLLSSHEAYQCRRQCSPPYFACLLSTDTEKSLIGSLLGVEIPPRRRARGTNPPPASHPPSSRSQPPARLHPPGRTRPPAGIRDVGGRGAV